MGARAASGSGPRLAKRKERGWIEANSEDLVWGVEMVRWYISSNTRSAQVMKVLKGEGREVVSALAPFTVSQSSLRALYPSLCVRSQRRPSLDIFSYQC